MRLYPTLIRFDSVYATLFKCSKRRIADYPALKAWLRRMYNLRVGGGERLQASLCFPHKCVLRVALADGATSHRKTIGLLYVQVKDSIDIPDAMRSYFKQVMQDHFAKDLHPF